MIIFRTITRGLSHLPQLDLTSFILLFLMSKVKQNFHNELVSFATLLPPMLALDPQVEWIEPGVPGLWFVGTQTIIPTTRLFREPCTET